MNLSQQFNHDFENGAFQMFNSNGNEIYFEESTGFWGKKEYDSNGNKIYFENSDGYWSKREYDSNGNEIYLEASSMGVVFDKRPTPPRNGKIVEIDGKSTNLKN